MEGNVRGAPKQQEQTGFCASAPFFCGAACFTCWNIAEIEMKLWYHET